MDVTVLEVHLPDAQFNAPFSSDSGGGVAEDLDTGAEFESEDETGSGGKSGIAAVVVMIGLAALAWYLRSGGSGPDETESPDLPSEDVA